MNFLNRLVSIAPETPVHARKVCLILGFGMFYGLLTGMGIGMVLFHAGVATAKLYFLLSMALAAILASAGVARIVWTATTPGLLQLVWRFAAGVGGAVAPVVITLGMGRHIRYGFLIGAIAGLIVTVGLIRTLPEDA